MVVDDNRSRWLSRSRAALAARIRRRHLLLTIVLAFSFVTTALGLVAFAETDIGAAIVLVGAALIVIVLQHHMLGMIVRAVRRGTVGAAAALALFYGLLASFVLIFSFGFWWDALALEKQGRSFASRHSDQLAELARGRLQLRPVVQKLNTLAGAAEAARMKEETTGGVCAEAAEAGGAGPHMMLLNAQTETYASMAASVAADLREFEGQLNALRSQAGSPDDQLFHSEAETLRAGFNERFVLGLRDEAALLKSDESAFASGSGFSDPVTGKPSGCLSPALATAAGQAAAEISRIKPLATSQPAELHQGKGREGVGRLISARLVSADWLALLVPFILAVATLLLALAPRRREEDLAALSEVDGIERLERLKRHDGEAGE
jgi:hypothetical protein